MINNKSWPLQLRHTEKETGQWQWMKEVMKCITHTASPHQHDMKGVPGGDIVLQTPG